MAVHTNVSVLSHVLHLSYCQTFWCSAPLRPRARHGVRDRWALLHQPLLPDGKQLRSCQCWTNVKEWLTTKLLQGGTLHARRESCSLRSLQQQHRGEDFKIYNLDQLMWKLYFLKKREQYNFVPHRSLLWYTIVYVWTRTEHCLVTTAEKSIVPLIAIHLPNYWL